jgi:hypothetical protein
MSAWFAADLMRGNLTLVPAQLSRAQKATAAVRWFISRRLRVWHNGRVVTGTTGTHHLTGKRQEMHKIASRSASIALALGTLSSVALAEPLELTEAQMDQVTAGAFTIDSAGILHDASGFDYTRQSDGRYLSSDGFFWEVRAGMVTPDGRFDLYFAPADAHGQPGLRAYGTLFDQANDRITDGGF